MLETELFGNETFAGEFPSVGLSLKRLYVWTMEPLQRFQVLHTLLQSCKNSKGGMLISQVYQYLDHGNPFVKNLVSALLPKVFFYLINLQITHPFFDMLQLWLCNGELNDPFHEFFICENVDYSDLWRSKYSLNMDLIPAFFSKSIVQKVKINVFSF